MVWHMSDKPTPLVVLGQVYGRLTVVGEIDRSQKHPRVKVRCSCGKTKTVLVQSIKSGHTKSCGCLSNEQRQAKQAQSWSRKHG
jgi:hypothetical protein